jgi:hypothetical protein
MLEAGVLSRKYSLIVVVTFALCDASEPYYLQQDLRIVILNYVYTQDFLILVIIIAIVK